MTFAEVAEAVGGVKRLVKEGGVYVGHHDETDESHPFFDEMAAISDADVNQALSAGGYEYPLASLTDPKLRNAWLGIQIGYLSQSSSDREQWMKDLEAAGRDYLALIASRAPGVIVLGAVEADESDDASGAIFGQFEDNRLFSVGDPYSDMNSVYGSLGPGPRRFGRSSR